MKYVQALDIRDKADRLLQGLHETRSKSMEAA